MLLQYLRCPIVSSLTIHLLRHFTVCKSDDTSGILDLLNNLGLAFTHFTSISRGSSGTHSWLLLLYKVGRQ
jgi:hypothetical protein